MSLREEGIFHLQKAIGLFLEWGSQALADMVLVEHAELWPWLVKIVAFADKNNGSATL
jgi:hypothetical protein